MGTHFFFFIRLLEPVQTQLNQGLCAHILTMWFLGPIQDLAQPKTHVLIHIPYGAWGQFKISSTQDQHGSWVHSIAQPKALKHVHLYTK